MDIEIDKYEIKRVIAIKIKRDELERQKEYEVMAQERPVFSRIAPQDIALRGLVKVVPSVYDALRAAHLR